MLTTLSGIVIDLKLVHPLNAYTSIVLMLDGIVIDLKLLQPKNTLSGRFVIPLPKVTVVSLLQFLNALLFKVVTVSGIFIDSNLLQL